MPARSSAATAAALSGSAFFGDGDFFFFFLGVGDFLRGDFLGDLRFAGVFFLGAGLLPIASQSARDEQRCRRCE